MNPAPPATRTLTPPPVSPTALRQVLGEAPAPVRKPDRVATFGAEDGERRARRRAGEHLGRPSHDAALYARLIEDLLRELVPGALALGGDVVDPEVASLRELGEPLAQVSRVGGATDLIGDHQHLRSLVP